MNEEHWRERLQKKGFRKIYIWEDDPNAYYPDHTHEATTARVVLAGEITVTSEGRTSTFRIRERFDVPAHTVHSARVGPQGCRYIIGEK